MKVSILTIGDEICIGQITNTNASWLANACTFLGAEVICHSSVRDDKNEIISEFNRLFSISDFIICTGGLGPTHDDISKASLIEYFNDEYKFHPDLLDDLVNRYKGRGIVFSDRNKSQALLPSKCQILYNKIGTAPGMLFENNGKYLIALPGVPMEMKSIMDDNGFIIIKQLIEKSVNDNQYYKTILTAGITESHLADLIGNPDSFLGDATLAFLPSYKGVRLRLGVKAINNELANKKFEQLSDFIISKAGKYIFGFNDDSLPSVIGNILKERNETLSVAESCTGGMLGAEFTEIPGSSSYFKGGVIAYSNEVKSNILKINSEIIAQYGAVSKETAEAMSINIREIYRTDYGISITGIAGPDGGTEEKPVGTVWISVSSNEKTTSNRFRFGNDRKINRERAVGTALTIFWKMLKGLEI